MEPRRFGKTALLRAGGWRGHVDASGCGFQTALHILAARFAPELCETYPLKFVAPAGMGKGAKRRAYRPAFRMGAARAVQNARTNLSHCSCCDLDSLFCSSCTSMTRLAAAPIAPAAALKRSAVDGEGNINRPSTAL